MATIITRRWFKGRVVAETVGEIEYEPNAADLASVQIKCACGQISEIPFDSLFFLPDIICGQCGDEGNFRPLNDDKRPLN